MNFEDVLDIVYPLNEWGCIVHEDARTFNPNSPWSHANDTGIGVCFDPDIGRASAKLFDRTQYPRPVRSAPLWTKRTLLIVNLEDEEGPETIVVGCDSEEEAIQLANKVNSNNEGYYSANFDVVDIASKSIRTLSWH